MAGTSSKKEKRKERKAQKQAAKFSTLLTSENSAEEFSLTSSNSAEEFYSNMNDTMNEIPIMGKAMDGIQRNLIQFGTVPAWTRRFASLPSLHGKTFAWVQLLLVDEQKTAQLKLYAVGSRLALAEDDSDIVERSRNMFKDAAPTFMNDFGLWIYSRSLVRKAYNGSIDAAALEFSPYDPLDSLDDFPMDSSAGIRCAEIFMLFAIEGDVPGDLCSRETVLEFLNSLNSEEGIHKIQAFTVTAGSVVATREKLQILRGNHLTAA